MVAAKGQGIDPALLPVCNAVVPKVWSTDHLWSTRIAFLVCEHGKGSLKPWKIVWFWSAKLWLFHFLVRDHKKFGNHCITIWSTHANVGCFDSVNIRCCEKCENCVSHFYSADKLFNFLFLIFDFLTFCFLYIVHLKCPAPSSNVRGTPKRKRK